MRLKEGTASHAVLHLEGGWGKTRSGMTNGTPVLAEAEVENGGRRFKIYVSRGEGLKPLPGDYESIEDAQYIFEKHRGEVRWCLIAEVEAMTERPVFVLHGEATGSDVWWQPVS